LETQRDMTRRMLHGNSGKRQSLAGGLRAFAAAPGCDRAYALDTLVNRKTV
jgi:hypothetical protein